MRLSDLHTGERARIVELHTKGAFRKRLMEMGFIEGEDILVVKNAPLKDPVEYRILNYDITLRRSEAADIEVERLTHNSKTRDTRYEIMSSESEIFPELVDNTDSKRIKVAFVGNPNSGKTSLFNAASGANEHVGNYSGVTVGVKTASYSQDGFTFDLMDLPGAYSISSYSPEEKFILQQLLGENRPDVILNVVDSTNLERNMYMTTQLMETNIPMVIALNMWDELQENGSTLNIPALSKLIGVPMTPTVGRTGQGLKAIFSQIIKLYENRSNVRRIIDVRYREELENAINFVSDGIKDNSQLIPENFRNIRPRFIAIKLLERDKVVEEALRSESEKAAFFFTRAKYAINEYEKVTDKDIQTDITNGKYGFVRGALQETYTSDYSQINDRNKKIDHILTHKVWGFPIFIAIMYLAFQLTFTLGAYPMDWIESGVAWIGNIVGDLMSDGPLKDLLVDGIIAGVGGVLVFLPNIVILYLCLAIIEDTGYMARAAFIMDRLMHLIGLHGRSFIPMIMGFGCNVPAVMATRTIENRNNRLITMMVIPFMSCSAKLPVYLLLAGAFFPKQAGLVLFALYFLGITVAIFSALLFKRFVFTEEDSPFVMELPPYRIPTVISVLLHMWQRAKQYLQKMASVILFASIIIWALGYFPQVSSLDEAKQEELFEKHIAENTTEEAKAFMALPYEQQQNMIQQEYSYIGRIGHTLQPGFQPLGFDWKMSVSLITGIAAKEVVVSTMGVLYTGDSQTDVGLKDKIMGAKYPNGDPIFTPVVAISFLVFVLVYFPCISTVIVIGKESGSYKWSLFIALYTITLAWVMSFIITQVGNLII